MDDNAGDSYRDFALEVLHAKVHDLVIEILAAKMRVSNSGQHLEDAILDSREGHIQQLPHL